MKTKYEQVNGSWYLILEDDDAAVVQAEVNRLSSPARFKAVDFIGPYKSGDKYMAKGLLHDVPMG